MTTNLRLLLDESVTDPLAELIAKVSALNVEYVREITHVKGRADRVVVDYARESNRIVVTTETGMNEHSFPVCTHPGIIILAGKHRHESIQGGLFQRFLLSGHRKLAKDCVTTISEGEATIKMHKGEKRLKLRKDKS